MLQPMHW